MLPFTNRKYPALSVLEVDHYTSPEKLVVQTDHFAVRVRPVAVSEVCCFDHYFVLKIINANMGTVHCIFKTPEQQ